MSLTFRTKHKNLKSVFQMEIRSYLFIKGNILTLSTLAMVRQYAEVYALLGNT